ncbi:MAG TPA: S49 family peptidase, partial [Gammaproteobacteria bacterium]|nr:S49 family peptidase [Gammaproteobacteria bacterium]
MFGGVWKVWDILCRSIINLVVTLLVLTLIVGAFASHHVLIPSSAALVVDIQGELVEQYSGAPGQRALARLLGQTDQKQQTRMRDVIDAIEEAADDKRIKALVLATDGMDRAELADLEDIARAIGDFKKTGKPVYALGSGYDQSQYFLAAQADTVFLHPQGNVFLQGFGIYQPYLKDALDKYGVTVNVFRHGKYKSAVEPFILNGMSPEARDNYTDLVGQLWGDYQQQVTAARKLTGSAIKSYVD